jgi:hypothetical protein
MPTPSRMFKNWTGVVFTPEGGVPIPITGVTNVDVAMRVQTISGSGDADYGPTSKHTVSDDPMFTVELQHLDVLRLLTPGLHGTFTAIHNNADNDEGSGAMEYNAAYAMIGDTPRGGRHRAYGTGRIQIETWRPDGRTSPISITISP